MRTATSGDYKIPEHKWRAWGRNEWEFWGRWGYKQARFNDTKHNRGLFLLQDGRPGVVRRDKLIPGDGTPKWSGPDEDSIYTCSYVEGPKDKAWMEEHDRVYLKRLLESGISEDRELFDREMATLDLSVSHHQILKREFAALVKRHDAVSQPTPSGARASEAACGAGGASAGDAASPTKSTLTPDIPEVAYTDLTIGQTLGRGGFGVVHKAKWLGKDVAVKQLLAFKFTEITEKELKREARYHGRFSHKNIVDLYAVCLEPNKYCLVMELMFYGSLFDVLHSERDLPWTIRLSIAQDIVAGLLYLHEQDIIHRDLKSLNVLLDEHMRAKLSDFGLARARTETAITTTMGAVGTPCWMAPELFESDPHCTKETDIYALAIVLWELVSRKLPYESFQGNVILMLLQLQAGRREKIPDDTPEGLSALITWGWKQAPHERPTIEQISEKITRLEL